MCFVVGDPTVIGGSNLPTRVFRKTRKREHSPALFTTLTEMSKEITLPAIAELTSEHPSEPSLAVSEDPQQSFSGIEDSLPLLSNGFLAHFEPTINLVENELRQLENKQQILLADMKATNERMETQDNYEYIASIFNKVPEYRAKLQHIRTTIQTLTTRSQLLRKRVAQLRTIKEQQLAHVARIQQRERDFDRTVLAAKVVAAPEMQTIVVKSAKKKIKNKSKEKGKDAGKDPMETEEGRDDNKGKHKGRSKGKAKRVVVEIAPAPPPRMSNS